MRKLLGSIFLSIVWILPATAKEAPQRAPSHPDQLQRHEKSLKKAGRQLEQSIRKGLAQAGFRDIIMAPTSFLIGAKDAKGEPVLLMFDSRIAAGASDGPSGAPGQQDESLQDKAPTFQPLASNSPAIIRAR